MNNEYLKSVMDTKNIISGTGGGTSGGSTHCSPISSATLSLASASMSSASRSSVAQPLLLLTLTDISSVSHIYHIVSPGSGYCSPRYACPDFPSPGIISNEQLMTDESELECHEKLRKLHNSTKIAKHFQHYSVCGIQGLISVSSKQMEIVRKLATDCFKYGIENQGGGYPLQGPSLQFGDPARLRLDPVKMREMRLLIKEYARPLQNSAQATPHRSTPPIAGKTPFPLLEYKHGSFDANSPGSILMVQQHKGMPPKTIKAE
ncbi:hypothetical protein HN51_019888, partial [Arachis hypogaea]